jgi:hypothetical protein
MLLDLNRKPEGSMEDREFNAAEVQALLNVFRQACADVGTIDGQTKSKIANRILGMARQGERDFETLRSYATVGLKVSQVSPPYEAQISSSKSPNGAPCEQANALQRTTSTAVYVKGLIVLKALISLYGRKWIRNVGPWF